MGRGKKTTNCTNISNMMGATSGADTANPSWAIALSVLLIFTALD
jgi:hypothetical protein